MRALLMEEGLFRKIFFASIVLIFMTSLSWALEPQITVIVETPKTPVVAGSTNSSEGTDLIITISRKESSYRAQDKVKVTGERFMYSPARSMQRQLSPALPFHI